MQNKLRFLIRDTVTPFLENIQIRLPKDYVRAIAPLPEAIKSVKKNEPFIIYAFFGPNFQDTVTTMKCYDSISNQEL